MHERPTLRGEAVTMRPTVVSDAESMFASLADREVMRLTGTKREFTLEEVQAYCARSADIEDRFDFVIVRNDATDTVVGEITLNDIDRDNESANFRIALYGQQNFGRGFGTEATQLLLRFGFEQLALHRIELEVFDFNPRAQHVYEKLGFVREGVRRHALRWEGRYHDAIQMSMLRAEYEQVAWRTRSTTS